MHTNDDQLVMHLQSGSKVAFQQIYNKYVLFLTWEAHVILDNPSKAAIAVEKAFDDLQRYPDRITGSLEDYLSEKVWEQCTAIRKAGEPAISEQLHNAITMSERLRQAVNRMQAKLSKLSDDTKPSNKEES